MLRMARTVGCIIGYAALVSTQLPKLKEKKNQIDDIRSQDEMTPLTPSIWSFSTLSLGNRVDTSAA